MLPRAGLLTVPASSREGGGRINDNDGPSSYHPRHHDDETYNRVLYFIVLLLCIIQGEGRRVDFQDIFKINTGE